MIRKMNLTLLLLVLVSCASKPQAQDDIGLIDESVVNKPFEKGMVALERENYQEAARIFDSLLVTQPGTELDLITTYNSGAAYEGMGNCARASERYREVVRSSAGKFQRLESEALYRVSIMYECMGNHAKAITALIDAQKRGKNLSYSVQQAEIPARLAAAYARLGNTKKALEYFNQANSGLRKIVAQETGRKQADILGNTLYLMGQLNPAQRRAEGDALAFMKGLSMQQPYLLQALELNHPVWSKRAAEDLNLAYDNIWQFKVADREKLNDYYTRGLQVIRELRRIRMPKAEPAVDAIFAKLDKTELRLQNELASVAESTPLTPDAEKREGLRREGRLVTPRTPLPPPLKKTRR